MIVCIFSFNRGRFLAHCVDSVLRCAPGARVCVVDDGSDDPQTVATLDALAARHEVLRPGLAAQGKHGGLYANMQRALEHFADAPLLLFLQDDMQLVRPLRTDEPRRWQAWFRDNPRAGFLQPCFIKGSARREEEASLRFDAAAGVYRRAALGRSVGCHYSDVSLCEPARLLRASWRFADSEPANERKAAALFEPLGQLFAPFAMWLPEVPAWRGKRKTLALRLAEQRRGCGFHPFDIMSGEEATALAARDPAVLPVAEDYLRCPSAPRQPWSYYPLQHSRLLKKLNSAEIFLRRAAGPKARAG